MQADTVPDTPPPSRPAPAPGTLRLQAKIIDIYTEDNNSSTIYEVQVLRTLGIGAGTPALVRNDTVKIISSKQSPKITNAMDVICLIKNRRTMAQHKDPARGWQLLEWELKNDLK